MKYATAAIAFVLGFGTVAVLNTEAQAVPCNTGARVLCGAPVLPKPVFKKQVPAYKAPVRARG